MPYNCNFQYLLLHKKNSSLIVIKNIKNGQKRLCEKYPDILYFF